jgi:hypothetical protein
MPGGRSTDRVQVVVDELIDRHVIANLACSRLSVKRFRGGTEVVAAEFSARESAAENVTRILADLPNRSSDQNNGQGQPDRHDHSHGRGAALRPAKAVAAATP